MTRRRGRELILISLTVLAAGIGAAGLAGCGLEASHASSRASVLVTRNFGDRSIGSLSEASVPQSQTVTRLLERDFRVVTRDRGRALASIDGLDGATGALNWFLYVNGVQATGSSAQSSVHKGDRIWLDLHDRTVTDSTPAVVGSFPEPFVHGTGGRRLPTVLVCGSDVSAACTRVAHELHAIGVPVANQVLGAASGTDDLTVLVGTWNDISKSLAGDLLAHGPQASGVYAKFTHAGRGLELLDSSGRVVRSLAAGAGLVAATSESSGGPTWLITGTDAAGVGAASEALTASRLENHFALAVQGRDGFPVPQP